MLSEDQSGVEQWGRFDVTLRGTEEGNPFLDGDLWAEFTHESGTIRVSGFYAGGGTYGVRFMPPAQGAWRYRTQSNVRELDNISGGLTCVAPSKENHGPVRVVDPYHFAHADGTPFHPVGTTCYVWNLQGDALEEQTLETLRNAPFNKIRFSVFPKRYVFNLNEPPSYPFPGEVNRDRVVPLAPFASQPQPPPDVWDFTRFNGRYFDHLEQRIADLQELGVEADLILFHPYDSGAWGFDQMPHEVNVRYLRYVVARLAAFRNVWWSFANEYDLLLNFTTEAWDAYFQLVQECDAFSHLRSIHNGMAFYDHGKAWVTHCSVQHHDLTRVARWQRQYGKPVVVDECGYEGNIEYGWGNLSAEELVRRFWIGFVSGGYVGHGETYWNDDEVLWWSKGGKLHGQSVPRIEFLRRVIGGVPGAGLVPLLPMGFSDFGSVIETREFLQSLDRDSWPFADGGLDAEASGRSGSDYCLFYFGAHQPLWRTLNLGQADFTVDVIDTWNMTVTRWAEHTSGQIRVALPGKPYQAIRIERAR